MRLSEMHSSHTPARLHEPCIYGFLTISAHLIEKFNK